MIKRIILSVALVLYIPSMLATITPACPKLNNSFSCTPLLTYEPQNLHTLKQEIVQYHDSGMWEKTRECLAHEAQQLLQHYIPVGAKKLAVIFDVDDTSLSSWDFNLKENFGYNFERYTAYELAGNMPVIKSTLKLYQFAKNHGFAVFFISARRESQRAITELNLLKAGFNKHDGLFLKPLDSKKGHAAEAKCAAREKIHDKGYTIVLSIGDQKTDFIGCPSALNNIKLPNPMYIVP